MKVIEKQYLIPFSLVGVLFLLWGLANNMTDTLLAAFRHIMIMTDSETSLIQFAFYGSYFCFALPAALFIQRYSFKRGILLGLMLYSLGCLLFYPAASLASYPFYLVAIYILAGGCSVLETTANPYILSMGSPETATRRLNIAQSLNPLGSISGILISQYFILGQLGDSRIEDDATRQAHELSAVSGTYGVLGIVLLAIMIIMLVVKMPTGGVSHEGKGGFSVSASFARLLRNRNYAFGVVAQFFYVGAQIGVWSFTIRLVMQELDMQEAQAANVYLVSIVLFCLARFVFTWLMRFFAPARLMVFAGGMDVICSLVVVLCSGNGMVVSVALVLVSLFMSLQFPTIYGLALENVGQDAKIGASGLIMAILGGALLTPLQGVISDMYGVNTSYIVPVFCFVVVVLYGLYRYNR